jgi:hypothetical protein
MLDKLFGVVKPWTKAEGSAILCDHTSGGRDFRGVFERQQSARPLRGNTAPRYLIRDRDASYGALFLSRLTATGISEVLSAPRSPWQNAYAERVIDSGANASIPSSS